MTRKFFWIPAAAMVLCSMPVYASSAQITEDEAKTAALEDCGLQEDELSHIYAELDEEDGRTIYEVEIRTDSHAEYDYEIDAGDAAILKASYERESVDGAEYMVGEEEGAVTLEEAQTYIIEAIELTEEDVTWSRTETEQEDGRTIHEIDFYTADNMEYELEVDQETGVILSWSCDASHSDANDEAAAISIIGGADGPTSIFLAGKLGG